MAVDVFQVTNSAGEIVAGRSVEKVGIPRRLKRLGE